MKKITYKILLISFFIILVFNKKSLARSDFSYQKDVSGNITITAYNGTDKNLTIPSTIDGNKVTAIGEHAFDESRNSTNGHTIENLIISEGIEKIGLLAFVKCTNLQTVKLPESLNFIDMQAFLQCDKLREINIPSKITKIADSTFQETGFTEFEIPKNVKDIASRALGICNKLEKVRIYSKDIKFQSGVFEYGSSNLVLYGYEGSTAQTYAKENGIKFELLSNKEEPSIPVEKAIKLNKKVLSLKENENEILEVSFIEMSPNTKLIWTSSDENVAIVKDGKVTSKHFGDAVITVSTEDGKYKDTCNLTVLKSENEQSFIEKNWTDIIKLSELKENEIYSYTANSTVQFPKIENDIGNNCIIYIKEKFENDYKQKINMGKRIKSNSISASFNEYNKGEKFNIKYKRIGNEELLKLIPKDKIIYLNKYKDGEKLEYKFEKYIYNNTEKDIILNIKDNFFNVEKSEVVTIPKGEIYGFDWMIDSVYIANLQDEDNNSNNDNKEENETKPVEPENKDDTVIQGKLPNTGINMNIVYWIIFSIIVSIVIYKKYNKIKYKKLR